MALIESNKNNVMKGISRFFNLIRTGPPAKLKDYLM